MRIFQAFYPISDKLNSNNLDILFWDTLKITIIFPVTLFHSNSTLYSMHKINTRNIKVITGKLSGQWEPDKVLLDDFYASAYIFLEMIAREVKTQIAGVTVVNDAGGLGWRHLRWLGLEQMRAIIAFMNGAFPLWFRRIHIVNQPR